MLDSRHFRVESIADGVYAAIAQDGGFALSNGGIIDLGDRTIVFDAMLHPQAGLDLRRAAERLTGRAPEIVVNSHYHGDHMLGNQAFLPASIVSTGRTREQSVAQGASELESDKASGAERLAEVRAGKAGIPERERALYEGWYEAVSRYSQDEVRIVPATLTFDSELTLHGSQRGARILSYGGGHTDSDTFVYVPDARAVFFGDLLSIGFHPWVADGHPEDWIRILRRISELSIDQVIPGHGRVGDKGEIRVMGDYLTEILRLAREAHAARRPRESLATEPMPSLCRDWKFSGFFPQSLQFAFDATESRPSSAQKDGH